MRQAAVHFVSRKRSNFPEALMALLETLNLGQIHQFQQRNTPNFLSVRMQRFEVGCVTQLANTRQSAYIIILG